MPNIHDQAREFLSNEKLGLFFSDEKKKAIFLFADWVSEQAAQQIMQATNATEPNCEIARECYFGQDGKCLRDGVCV